MTTKKVERRVYRTVTVTKKVRTCEPVYVVFGELVRNARKALGWNQLELAEALGYARASIANIETGRQRVLLDDLFKFAKVLKVKPLEIFQAVAKA